VGSLQYSTAPVGIRATCSGGDLAGNPAIAFKVNLDRALLSEARYRGAATHPNILRAHQIILRLTFRFFLARFVVKSSVLVNLLEIK
jgi:hypothetical protein